ncbi:regulator of G-protein signaling 20-like isoform X1 [Macrobrachium rosenbergii]|uniref:regulator of G-protein signaling 20-like isoform X1 n=1 Tax=Macrobrachium rosenbergii TaxID=79674 RepID=UPI0034D62F49
MSSVTTEGNMARLPQGSPGSGGGCEEGLKSQNKKDKDKDIKKSSNKNENSVRNSSNNGGGAAADATMTTGGGGDSGTATLTPSSRGVVGGSDPVMSAPTTNTTTHTTATHTSATSTATAGATARANNQQRSKRCCFFWCCCCRCSCIRPPSSRPPQNSRLNGDNEPPPTIEEIRAWSDSFDRLMKCSGGRQAFRDFLKCEYSEENILFWQACEELKVENNPALIEEKARLIYEDYISILSPKEVSLDSRVREIINRNMVDPTPHTFDEAQMQIYTLMHRDSYPRFINSAIYKRLAQLNNNGSSSNSKNESAT